MKDSLLLDLVHALDMFALERMPDHTFIAVTPPPAWVTHVWAISQVGEPLTITNAFPFLERFLSEADAFWRAGMPRTLLSGSFVAAGVSEELLLRACALNLGPRSVLVLERLKGEADVRQVLQKSRENKLLEEQLHQRLDAVRTSASAASKLLAQLMQTESTAVPRELVEKIASALASVERAAGSK